MNDMQFQSCIDVCNSCANACDFCAASCLKEQDVAAMAGCIALDMDCAQICRLAAGVMSRNSRHAAAVCKLCATLCKACGDECAKHQMDHCQQCAKACHACAAECERMAASA